MLKTLDVFIGYDPRESVAYHVCSNSIIRHSTSPVAIHPLALKNLAGYEDPKDQQEGYPQTNQFIFSRFLVPELMGYNGWAVFVDGDMILRDDITKLFNSIHAIDGKAVYVVKHDYKTKSNTKYLNQHNGDYPRKNWSSVILFNCGHFKNKRLTTDYIQHSSGEHLHRFGWLEDKDIGELQPIWNWLPDEYGENHNAKLLHWTLGTPCFLDQKYAEAPMASEWHRERMLTDYSMQSFVPK